MAGRLARGEVRLYSFAPPDKVRPVLILTRDSALKDLATATVAPITSSIRGIRSELLLDELDGMQSPCVANLHNILTVPQHRLGKRIAGLSEARMRELCKALGYALACA